MRFWGWILRIVVVALGICLFMLQSEYAKKSILEFFLNQPLKYSSLKVDVQGVRGLFPFQFEVGSMDLKSTEGLVAGLKDVIAVWSVPSLLAGHVKFDVEMKNQLAGEVVYNINKHALFVGLKGDGLVLGNQAALKSVIVDLPELTLVKGTVVAIFHDANMPTTLSMQLEEMVDDRMKVNDILLVGNGIDGKGSAIFYPKQDNWEGNAEVSIKDLAHHQSRFSQDIGGSADINFQKQLGGQLLVDATFKQFHYGRNQIKLLELQHLMKKAKHHKVTLQGQDALINNIPLTHVSASGFLEDYKGKFDIVGRGPKTIAFDAQGTMALSSDDTSAIKVIINRAQLHHQMHQFHIKKPATIVWNENGLRVDQIWLAVGEGALILQELNIENEMIVGNLLINQLPLTILRVFNPDWVASGSLSGKGYVKNTTSRPEVELSVRGKALQWGALDKNSHKSFQKPLSIDLVSEFKMKQGQLNWQIKLGSEQVFQLNTQGILSVEGWYPTQESTLEGMLKGQGDVGMIARILQNGDLISGKASFDLAAKGTINNPKINGHISVTNGVYENAAFGTFIRNIKLQGNAVNDAITFTSITGQDNAKGRVTGHGFIKLTSFFHPEVDLQLQLDKLIVVQNDEISGKASGSLKLQGALFGETNKAAKISGDVVLQPLEIHLEDHVEKVVTIQLLEKKKDGKYETPKEHGQHVEVQRDSVPIPLDIILRSLGNIYIRGYGLDAQWKGEMRALGVLSDPYLVGSLTLVRGKLDLLGKPLKLTEGKIGYTENPKNDPLLAIVGTREVGEITAIMSIDGHASDPKITFSSTPALPQEEVLARLLFGRGVESMSVTQSLLLANALSAFKGKNNLNFTDKIRTAFGLDVLEFKERKPSEGDEYQSATQMVSVGKQITEKVYLSLDQSVSGDSGTSATLQYDVTPSLKIEADVGGDVNAGVGFAWVKKY
jgi:translocation and assembly module TamB